MQHTPKFIALAAAALLVGSAEAQIQFGIRVGGNYVIASQSIEPTPKEAPTTPKGLGLQFGGYMKLPFSEMVGLRPELGFSFRRVKSENTTTETGLQVVDQNNQPIGTAERKTTDKSDQRLQYFQISAPLTISPNSNLRFMVGPSFGFLMGGKLNTDETVEVKGTANGQSFTNDPVFTATSKTGSSATKDFTKAEVLVLAGVGYELDMGLDFDLRFYRGIVTAQDISQSNLRYKAFTNMIELSIGWTFGN